MRGFPDMLRNYNIWAVFTDDNQEDSRPGKGRAVFTDDNQEDRIPDRERGGTYYIELQS